ncbi:MAG: hypothetical protein HY692_04605, partial [Cyanobacteria bacterium NC_groundwater_1444_Ag_S-0.65um_54_12]|nr:hypothetical protein [Cyanobacteria bacterium NC_groundwater_1444_Ag_S-0.65um_54_12]
MAARKYLIALIVAMVAVIIACGKAPQVIDNPKRHKLFVEPKGGASQFYTHNVIYRLDEDIVAEMPDLVADIHVFEPNQPFIPTNIADFVVKIHTGDLIIDDKSLSHL